MADDQIKTKEHDGEDKYHRYHVNIIRVVHGERDEGETREGGQSQSVCLRHGSNLLRKDFAGQPFGPEGKRGQQNEESWNAVVTGRDAEGRDRLSQTDDEASDHGTEPGA